MTNTEPLFYQLFDPETSTYTYILADESTREAVIIDPVLELTDRDLKWLEENSLKLKYIIDTHVHADHVTGAHELKKKTSAKSGVSAHAQVKAADLQLKENDILELGSHRIKVLETPGHTNSCLSFVVGNKVFTGDALLIRSTGRTDFQQGSSDKLFESVTQKLFTLPDSTLVYPGHDYKGLTSSTILAEKTHNPRLFSGQTKAAFAEVMRNLKLANPRKIEEAVPANLRGGQRDSKQSLIPDLVNGVPTFKPQQVKERLSEFNVIDVREEHEFNAQYGHIPIAKLVPLSDSFDRYMSQMDKQKPTLLVCRSGGRSHEATSRCMQHGLKNVSNLAGGMILWNELGYPVRWEE